LYDADLVNSSNSVQSVEVIADSEFGLLNVGSTGRPTSCTYQPFINYGVLKVWPTPDSEAASNWTLDLTYQSPFEGFTAASETPDFPQEWQMALIWALAADLAPEYGLPITDRDRLDKKAKEYMDMAMSGGMEDASLFIKPDYD
jgi:hypothetical protein